MYGWINHKKMRQNGTEILIKCTDFTRQPDILFFVKSIYCESFTIYLHVKLQIFLVSTARLTIDNQGMTTSSMVL